MSATATCPCVAEYGTTCEVADIASAECVDCGYTTTDHTTLLMWNGYGAHVGDCDSERSRWTSKDGSVTMSDDALNA